MTRPIGTAAELERRRRRAVDLLEQGESPSTIARILGVHETSVHRWRRLARQGPGLAAKPHPGRKPLLSDEQWLEVQRLLLRGAKAHGWRNDLWTADRVAALIKRRFGVHYHPEHVRSVLKGRFHWSSHKPETRPREQNEKEVERWKGDEFPRIVRDAFQRRATLVFLDEAGFMLTPLVRRSLWPRGLTQVIDALQRHDRISAISCVTLGVNDEQPELYFELLPHGLNVTAENIVAFLSDLRRELAGPLTIVWDRHRIHSRARLVQEWLAKQTDVVLEDLPAYAPKLNPDEMVWSWLKYGRLANLCPSDVAELKDHLITELDWATFDGELLAGFFNHAELGVRL
jgi:transposase